MTDRIPSAIAAGNRPQGAPPNPNEVQYFNDQVVLGAVNDIETLTTGLSGKIWQKIRLLERTPAV